MRLLPCLALLTAAIVACSPSPEETATSALDEIAKAPAATAAATTVAATPPTGMSPENLVCMVTLSRYAEAVHDRIMIARQLEGTLRAYEPAEFSEQLRQHWLDRYIEFKLAQQVVNGNYRRTEQDCPAGFGYATGNDAAHEGVAPDDVAHWLRQIAVADIDRFFVLQNACFDLSPRPEIEC